MEVHENKSHRSSAARPYWVCIPHPASENLDEDMSDSPYLQSSCQGDRALVSHWELIPSFSLIQSTGNSHWRYNFLNLNSQSLEHRMQETLQCLSEPKMILTRISDLPEGCPNHKTRNEEPLSSFMQEQCCSCIKASPNVSMNSNYYNKTAQFDKVPRF